MNPTERERWEHVQRLFLAALDLHPDRRERFLAERCRDEGVRREVSGMIEASDEADAFFAGLASRAGTPFAPSSPVPDLALARFGAYRLLRRLGEGGMGAVYLAERADGHFRMRAAVKLLPPLPGFRAMHPRFLAERQILASLDHPGIARLLDGGVTDEGIPYFVMEYVQGEPIDRFCDARRLGIGERLALFRQVCEAVGYAHGASVVHRDLKPSNILVTADGRVKLLDFGIAKVIDGDFASDSTLTLWGGRPLTPAYASPEQLVGEPAGFASDVYQLGVLLYHLLVGCAPYPVSGRTPAEVKRIVREHEPPPPSEMAMRAGTGGEQTAEARAAERGTTPAALRARLRGGLDAVALEALHKRPDRRYPSVAALADDVARCLDGHRVRARRRSRLHRLGTALRRPRLAAGAAAVTLLVGAVLALGGAGATGPFSILRSPAVAPVAGSASTTSLVAYRFYQEGLRAYYRGQPSVAYPFFRAAVREDTAFAMAAYYLGRSTRDDGERYSRIGRAKRLAQEATERERLLIAAEWANLMSDPSLRAVADTLAARYPDEMDGHYLLGIAFKREGDFLAAVPYLERVVARDSASFAAEAVLCRGCDALDAMVEAYALADSLPAAERAARRWVRVQPASARAWERLAWTLWRQERGEEALAARREAAQRRSVNAHDLVYPAVVAIRLGDYADADALLAERVRDGTPLVQREALWWQVLGFRYQGRLREALASARRYRALLDAQDSVGSYAWQRVAPEAQVLFDMGRYRESARLIDSAAAGPFAAFSETRQARQRLWLLTHSATAAMAAGDTVRVRELADTIQRLGGLSGFGRDRRLHHYPRGLLLAARGEHEAAAAAFRRSIFSASGDFVRPKLELARQLLLLERPDEAIALLQAALRGPLAGGGFYATRPEVQLLLGEAWAAAGRADSAATYYRKAADAWTGADAEVARRLGAVEGRGAGSR